MFNKQNLIDTVHENLRGTKSKAEELVEDMFIVIKKQLKNGVEVKIGSFGIFKVMKTNPRNARNPKTGESVKVPARRKIKFIPATTLKELINL